MLRVPFLRLFQVFLLSLLLFPPECSNRTHGRALSSRRGRCAVSHGSVLCAEGPPANSLVQTESAVREIIMCVADLFIVLNNRPDPGGALAVLSLQTPTAHVLGVRCKTLGWGHHSILVCGEAFGTGVAEAASGQRVPWGHHGWFVLVNVRP